MDQAPAKAPKHKTWSETIDFYTSQRATYSEKNAKKEARTLKWYKTSLKKANCYRHLSLLNYSRNASPYTVTDDTYLTVSHEISKTGRSSKNNFQSMWLSETWFTSIVLHKFWSSELCNGPNNQGAQMTTLKPSKKDLKLSKIKPFRLLRISKTEATASRLMLPSQEMMYIKSWEKCCLHIMSSHLHPLSWSSSSEGQAQAKERK